MKIIGMVPVYNEEDMIEEVLENLISQDIQLVVLDNGSTDSSFEICKKFLNKGVLDLIQFHSTSFNASLVFEMLYDMALRHAPDWFILNASDEILESGEKNVSLKQFIIEAENNDSNIIQLDRFDFLMTNEDKSEENVVKKRMKYYSYQGDYVYRIWKYFPGTRIGDTAGHYPIFPENHFYKIYKKKIIMRHYPFRTSEQARKKMRGRVRESNNQEKQKIPINAHFNKIMNQDYAKKIDISLLSKYEEDGIWNHSLNFQPFETIKPPKKEELFTDDGFLRNPPLSAYDLKLLLNEKLSKSLIRRVYRKVNPSRKNHKK